MKKVDVIASGYEWVCPKCGTLNKEMEYKPYYCCCKCAEEVQANLPEHAMG